MRRQYDFMRKFFFLFVIGLSACSSASTIADEPLRSGDSHTFSASYAVVKGITPASINDTHVKITQQTETDEGTIILISKGGYAPSWGFVGRVFIEKSDGKETTVYVTYKRRSDIASGVLGEPEYSGNLFRNIERSIKYK